MTKFTKEKLYTELSIQIATLEAKVDKILQLLMKPEVEIQPLVINADNTTDYGLYNRHFVDNGLPPQWPNESRTDYLKRIGQYVEACSDNEKFDGDFK